MVRRVVRTTRARLIGCRLARACLAEASTPKPRMHLQKRIPHCTGQAAAVSQLLQNRVGLGNLVDSSTNESRSQGLALGYSGKGRGRDVSYKKSSSLTFVCHSSRILSISVWYFWLWSLTSLDTRNKLGAKSLARGARDSKGVGPIIPQFIKHCGPPPLHVLPSRVALHMSDLDPIRCALHFT